MKRAVHANFTDLPARRSNGVLLIAMALLAATLLVGAIACGVGGVFILGGG